MRDAYATHEEAMWVANVGTLIEPVDKYNIETKILPENQYAHNFARRAQYSMHGQDKMAKGVLGRMQKALEADATPYNTAFYSMAGNQKIGTGGNQPQTVLSPGEGIIQYDNPAANGGVSSADFLDLVGQNKSSNYFGQTYQDQIEQSISQTADLATVMASNPPTTEFDNDQDLAKQFKKVAHLINPNPNPNPHPHPNPDWKVAHVIRQRNHVKLNNERQAFYVES